MSKAVSIDLSTKAFIQRGPTSIYKVSAYNSNAQDCWLYIYDAKNVNQVTVGSTERVTRILVPGGSPTARGGNGEDFDFGLDVLNGVVLGVKTVAGADPSLPLEVEVWPRKQAP